MTKSKFTKLESCDPFSCMAAKINACERVINNIFRKHLAPFEITTSQFTILMVIYQMGKARQVDLCQNLVMEKSSLNRNLKRLIDKKLIHVADRKQISIQKKGKQLLESSIPAWDKAKAECAQQLKQDGLEALNLLFGNLVLKK